MPPKTLIKHWTAAFCLAAVTLLPGLGAPQPGDEPRPAPVPAAATEPAGPLTLETCYALALRQSELIAVDAERIKQAEARFTQALGTALPQVSFSRTETRQQASAAVPADTRYYEQKFTFRQSLFSGFKEFAGMAGSRLEKQQFESEKRRAEQLLFTDVSDAFYLLLEVRRDIQTLETIRSALNERVADLKERENLGKSRTSEVVSTQTQLYSIEDEMEAGKSQERVARQLLEFLVGRPVDQVAEGDPDAPLGPEPEYLSRACAREDVRAADFARQTDLKRLTVARSGYYPTLDLQGDYFTHRFSNPQDSDWDALLVLNVPLFNGTVTLGQVREAAAVARQSDLLFRRAERAARQDIHDAYVNAQSAFARVKVLEKALKSAELNYELQTKDYKMSVVNNLDVLNAIQGLEDIRRKYNHIVYESRRLYWQLRVAAGEIGRD